MRKARLTRLSTAGGALGWAAALGLAWVAWRLSHELKRHAHTVARGDERLRQVIDLSPDPIVVHWAGRIRHANPAATAALGYAPGELTGRSLLSIVHPRDRPMVTARVGHMEAGQSVPLVDERMVAKDGSDRWVEVAAMPTWLDDQPAIVAIAHDVTERHRLDEERQRLLREAERGIRMRDEFISVASHELKTPVTALSLELDLLWRVLAGRIQELPADLQRRLDALRPSVLRLGSLIDDLLDASVVRGGGVALELEDVDLVDLVRREVAHVRSQHPRSRCEVILRAEAPVVGRWDRKRLAQVVGNLLDNAFKYGPDQPVEVSVESGDGRARLAVRDHGIGIEPADQARIFQLFQRASSQSWGGLGLGLYLVRRFTEAHGGAVTVESAAGQGATFRVDLPLRPPGPLPASAS